MYVVFKAVQAECMSFSVYEAQNERVLLKSPPRRSASFTASAVNFHFLRVPVAEEHPESHGGAPVVVFGYYG